MRNDIVTSFPHASQHHTGAVVTSPEPARRPLDRTELTLLSLLATVLVERGTLAVTVQRIGAHLAALGPDADPAVVAGLRLAVDGLAMVYAARHAVHRSGAREKSALLAGLPVSGNGHVTVALNACIQADRRALRMSRSDLA